uniref:Uncharacterized protein n=1 Tax=Echinococcus granulosus TaxID=6210 RepID=A0A068WQN5_ECHGR|nr:hypothetical protein EgrG_002031200 [Echinococcus granulosus]
MAGQSRPRRCCPIQSCSPKSHLGAKLATSPPPPPPPPPPQCVEQCGGTVVVVVNVRAGVASLLQPSRRF